MSEATDQIIVTRKRQYRVLGDDGTSVWLSEVYSDAHQAFVMFDLLARSNPASTIKLETC